MRVKMTNTMGGLGLQIDVDRWHIILGILCGTERSTVFGGALFSGTAHLAPATVGNQRQSRLNTGHTHTPGMV